jgi:biopolymer transport protein ExbB
MVLWFLNPPIAEAQNAKPPGEKSAAESKAKDEPKQSREAKSIVGYFLAGGIFMWPLLVCSILAVAVVLERGYRLRSSVLLDPRVVEDIQSQIEKGDLLGAVNRHHSSPSLVGRILSRGLQEYMTTKVDIETALTEAGERGLQVLYNNLSVINLIAKVAPLLGLLGTVQGMILGFETLNLDTAKAKEDLADAIAVALITTFAGLTIAIPTVVANSYFRSTIRRLVAQFEEVFLDVIKTVQSSPHSKQLPSSNHTAGVSERAHT